MVNFTVIGDLPDSKVHGANIGPTWVLSAPGGPHVGPNEPCYLGAGYTGRQYITSHGIDLAMWFQHMKG